MKGWHKEPLLHFLIIGAMIFVVFSIVNKDEIDVSGNKGGWGRATLNN